jgi:hypothetical protein
MLSNLVFFTFITLYFGRSLTLVWSFNWYKKTYLPLFLFLKTK